MTEPTKIRTTGILFAGGESKRMGKEKGLIPVGDYLLYQYPLRVLESLTQTILISTCKAFDIKEAHEQVCDEIAGIGPMGGLYTCLKYSTTDLNLILPYDLPLVHSDLFHFLMPYAKEFEVVVPAMESGKPEPLCGIYSKSVLPVIQEMIQEEDYTMHQLVKRVHSKIVQVDSSLSFFHERLFRNINTPTDLEDILPERE